MSRSRVSPDMVHMKANEGLLFWQCISVSIPSYWRLYAVGVDVTLISRGQWIVIVEYGDLRDI